MKRIVDFLLSLLFIVVFLPVMLVVAMAVWLDSGLPIFFVQERIGWRGKPFGLVKFRSMTRNSHSAKGAFDAGNVSRVTRIGKIMRKTKLDELPQFFNVLAGHMSLVGPRPEVRKWTQIYTEKWSVVHRARPGITDFASLKFRNEEEILQKSSNPEQTYQNDILPQKLDLNIEYVRSMSLFIDAKILWMTFLVLVRFNK